MEKNIKDYLPFYLGCEVEMKRGHYLFPHPVLLSASLLAEYLQTCCLVGGIELKPILQPFRDLTEAESSQIAKIYVDLTIKNEEFTENGLEILIGAEITAYLLSKHFDLFGLIDAGLAIDKTKIKML